MFQIDPQLIVDSNPPPAWVEAVENGVDFYNIAVSGLPDFYQVGFLIKGTDRALSGGILGDIWGRWLHIRRLWVEPRLRGLGYATSLMASAERYARAKKCIGAFLSTASYEAHPLYERIGYQVYGELPDHPVEGHRRYFMSKMLGPRSATVAASDTIEVVMDPYPSPQTLQAIRTGIAEHAAAAMGLPEYSLLPLHCFLRSKNGEIVGGALGNTWGRWLRVSHLWVDTALRGQGLAMRLMDAIEGAAIRRGSIDAFLDVFSFNARPLYEKLRYRVFAELPNHPVGHHRYSMAKRLAA
jgi:GNAT superfamily N-acetyltransferase